MNVNKVSIVFQGHGGLPVLQYSESSRNLKDEKRDIYLQGLAKDSVDQPDLSILNLSEEHQSLSAVVL